MRTLFCSHLNGVYVAPAFGESIFSPKKHMGGTSDPRRDAPASLGLKSSGGELPPGQGGAEPPAWRRAPARRNPHDGETP